LGLATNFKGTPPIETPNVWHIKVGIYILVTNGMKVDIMTPYFTFQKWEEVLIYWMSHYNGM